MSLEKDEKPVILDEESFSTPLNVTSDEDQEEKGDSVPPTPVSSVPADPSPDGGSKAWLQVLGSFFLFFNSWGLVNSFGVFQTYYETGLLSHESPSDISWIGSIQAFLLLIVGAASGPTYDAGYFYALVWTGSFLIVFGIMMTSLCTQYWQVMLSQGICLGLGSGLIFVPSVAILPQYFTSRKALATGISTSGSSLGGIIYPIVFSQLEPRIGFPWATRVLGFIALALLVISLSCMRIRVMPKQKRALLELAAFKEPPYILFTFAMFLGFVGLYTPIYYISSYAIQEHITDTNLGFYMLPILNAASVFGRIIPNFFADKIGPLNILIPCSLAAGILAFCWIRIKEKARLIVFATLYGFFSGTYVSLPPTALVQLSPTLRVVGTRMGMCFALSSLGLLIGTPVSGAILHSTGNYVGPQALAGAATLIASFVLLLARITKVGVRLMAKA